LLNQFEQTQKMMKQFGGLMKGKGGMMKAMRGAKAMFGGKLPF
jgi:signal recognition particle GTPase